MPLHYEIDQSSGFVRLHASARLSQEDIREGLAAFGADPRFDPDLGALWDLRAVYDLQLSVDDLVLLGAASKVFTPSARRAIVVDDERTYSLARLYQLHRQSSGDSQLGVFRWLADAEQWLDGTPAG